MKDKERKSITLEVSSHTWPVICVGTYDGQSMDPEYLFSIDDEREYLWGECGEFVSYFCDFDKLKQLIVSEAQRVFDKDTPLSEYGIKVKVTGMGSPIEYNFTTDWLTMDVEVPPDFLEKAKKVIMAPEHREAVEKYIKKHWASRDGFISAMPYPLTEFVYVIDDLIKKATENPGMRFDDCRECGAVLSLLTLCEEPEYLIDSGGDYYDGLTGSLEETIRGNHCVSEVYTVYDPVKLLRKHRLDSEIKIRRGVPYDKIGISDIVHMYLDDLACADEGKYKGKKEKVKSIRKHLIGVLERENLIKLEKIA